MQKLFKCPECPSLELLSMEDYRQHLSKQHVSDPVQKDAATKAALANGDADSVVDPEATTEEEFFTSPDEGSDYWSDFSADLSNMSFIKIIAEQKLQNISKSEAAQALQDPEHVQDEKTTKKRQRKQRASEDDISSSSDEEFSMKPGPKRHRSKKKRKTRSTL